MTLYLRYRKKGQKLLVLKRTFVKFNLFSGIFARMHGPASRVLVRIILEDGTPPVPALKCQAEIRRKSAPSRHEVALLCISNGLDVNNPG